MDKKYLEELDNEALLNVFRGTCMSPVGLQHSFSVEEEILRRLGEDSPEKFKGMAHESACVSCTGCDCADKMLEGECPHNHLNAGGMCVDCDTQITDAPGCD